MPELTTVVSVRGLKPAEWLAGPNHVYVGRSCAGFPQSRWANPCRVRKRPGSGRGVKGVYFDTAEQALAGYRRWLAELMASAPDYYDLSLLRGKVCGCWCGNWPENPNLLCHGVTLATMANALDLDNDHRELGGESGGA